MSSDSIKAYKCTKCNFINKTLNHCCHCDSHILFQVLLKFPKGYDENLTFSTNLIQGTFKVINKNES